MTAMPVQVALTRRNIAGWFIGNVASMFAFAALELTLAWAAISVASPAEVGLTLVAFAVPQIVLPPVGGVLADRVNLKALIVGVDFTRALLTLAITLLLAAGLVSLPTLIVFAVMAGALAGVFEPGIDSLPPSILPRSELGRVGPIQTTAQRVTLLGAPAAGFLISWLGVPAALGMSAALFFVSACGLSLVTPVAKPERPADSHLGVAVIFRTFGTDFVAGVKIVLKSRLLAGLLILASVSNLGFSGPMTVGIPLLSKIQGWGPVASGGFIGVFAVAATATGALLARVPRVPRAGVWLLPSVVVQGLALVGIGLAPNLVLALAASLVLGGATGFNGSLLRSLLITNSPAAAIGRIQGMRSISQNAIAPLSFALAGAAVARYSALVAFVVGGALILLVAIAFAFQPSLRTAEIIVEDASADEEAI